VGSCCDAEIDALAAGFHLGAGAMAAAGEQALSLELLSMRPVDRLMSGMELRRVLWAVALPFAATS
jgi:hypothetical protein